MMKSQNKYSIRKFSVGASSILIATLLFLSGGQAQAAEKQVNMGNFTGGYSYSTIYWGSTN